MHKITPAAGAAAAALALAFAGQGAAHDAVPVCPTIPGGPYTATNDAKFGTPTVTVQPDGSLLLTWPDGFMRTKPAPSGCAEPVPTPVPPVPEQIPPPVFTPPGPPPVAPPTCADLARLYPKAGKARRIAWGCAVPNTPKIRASRSMRVVRVVACKGVGSRGYRVVRTTITRKRGPFVVSRKVTTRVVRGKVCRPIAVTG